MSIEKLRTEARREQITQAALQLIAGGGVKGLNMAGLARRVGVVPSALYRHFKNKDQVWEAVLELLRERLMGNIQMVREQSSESLDQLKRLLALHLRLILEYQAFPRILFSEELYGSHPERRKRLYAIVTGYLQEVAGIVREGQQTGRIREEIQPDTAAVMFLGLIQPSAVLWHLSDGGFDAARHIERAWPMFCNALATALSSQGEVNGNSH
jgi:AcrR family transcriptional regulator